MSPIILSGGSRRTEEDTKRAVPRAVRRMSFPRNSSFQESCYDSDDPYDRCPLHLPNGDLLYTVTMGATITNALCSPISMLSNFVIIFVVYKTPSLHTPADILLSNLAFADFLTGLLGQPSFAASLAWETVHGQLSCALHYFGTVVGFISSGLAFCSLTIISLERYMALFFHLRYQELVTARLALATVVAIWLGVLFLIALWFVQSLRYFVRIAAVTAAVTCFLITCVAHFKILNVALRHRRQIQPGPTSTNSKVAELKLAVSMAYIVWIYVICYSIP